jgi:putative endonuclease
VAWHRSGVNKKRFTSQYQVYRLVYFEEYTEVGQAIEREKQLKGWRRGKKLRLIQQFNPEWADLAPPAAPGPARRAG